MQSWIRAVLVWCCSLEWKGYESELCSWLENNITPQMKNLTYVSPLESYFLLYFFLDKGGWGWACNVYSNTIRKGGLGWGIIIYRFCATLWDGSVINRAGLVQVLWVCWAGDMMGWAAVAIISGWQICKGQGVVLGYYFFAAGVGVILGWAGDIRGWWVDPSFSVSWCHWVFCLLSLIFWTLGSVFDLNPSLYAFISCRRHLVVLGLVCVLGINTNLGVIRQDWFGRMSFRWLPHLHPTPKPKPLGSRNRVCFILFCVLWCCGIVGISGWVWYNRWFLLQRQAMMKCWGVFLRSMLMKCLDLGLPIGLLFRAAKSWVLHAWKLIMLNDHYALQKPMTTDLWKHSKHLTFADVVCRHLIAGIYQGWDRSKWYYNRQLKSYYNGHPIAALLLSLMHLGLSSIIKVLWLRVKSWTHQGMGIDAVSFVQNCYGRIYWLLQKWDECRSILTDNIAGLPVFGCIKYAYCVLFLCPGTRVDLLPVVVPRFDSFDTFGCWVYWHRGWGLSLASVVCFRICGTAAALILGFMPMNSLLEWAASQSLIEGPILLGCLVLVVKFGQLGQGLLKAEDWFQSCKICMLMRYKLKTKHIYRIIALLWLFDAITQDSLLDEKTSLKWKKARQWAVDYVTMKFGPHCNTNEVAFLDWVTWYTHLTWAYWVKFLYTPVCIIVLVCQMCNPRWVYYFVYVNMKRNRLVSVPRQRCMVSYFWSPKLVSGMIRGYAPLMM
ncbi:hypothetical protein Hanom_Chr02g00095231 [Helianthus anomalus]